MTTTQDEGALNTAIVGGGRGCEAILRMVYEDALKRFRMCVLGVADIDPEAAGMRYAREAGVEWVTTDYRELYTIPELDLIIELTGSEAVRDEIEATRPRHIKLIDHFAAQFLWDLHQAEEAIIEQRNLLGQQVEAERERITQIVDSIPDEVMVVDTELVVQHANATFLQHHGLRLEEVQGRPYHDISEQLRGEIGLANGALKRVLDTKRPFSLVRKHLDPTGEVRYAAIEGAPMVDLEGNVTGMVEMTRDISHRILLEEELKATEVQLKKFMELAPLATYVKNRQGEYIEVNRATCTLLGLDKREMIGKKDAELLPEEAASVMRYRDQDVLQNAQQVSFETKVQLGEHPLFLSTLKYPVLDANGTATAVVGLSKNVTKQRETEAELFRTRDYLQNILHNAPMMVVTTDLEGRIVSFNRQAEASHGYKATEVRGKPVTMLFASPQEWEPLLRRVAQGATVQDHETTQLRKDGGQMIVSVTLAQLRDNAGNMIGTVAMSRDISQRKALMRQIIQSERLASVGRLAAGVAHEINNPMAVIAEITGYLGDLMEGGDRTLFEMELREGLPKVASQIQRVRRITSRLLSFARKSEVPMEVADVGAALTEIFPFLEKKARLAGVVIHRRLHSGLPPVSIEDLLLEEVLINLIRNAIHAMSPRGHGNIWLFAVEKDGKVILTVRDDGPGIAEEVKDRLFDPFVSTKPVGKGTGLGLSICYGIVKQHGGDILVESEPGKGASFHVMLPIHHEVAASQQERSRHIG